MEKIVIKLGGAALSNTETLRELGILVSGLVQEKKNVVVVHGGGPAINEALTRRGISWTFIDGQRQTTPEMAWVIDEVLSVQVNSQIVGSLLASGVPATGLSGARDGILFCSPESAELIRVGKIEDVNVFPITTLLNNGIGVVPVIAPIGLGASGEKFNINADVAAARMAIALGASTLIFLTDQVGVLDGNKHLVSQLTPGSIARMIRSGDISGGMLTKVRAMLSALDAGIGSVKVFKAANAGLLLKNADLGTTLTREKNVNHERIYA